MCSVTQSCPTLCDPTDYSPPGSSVHGDSLGKNTGVGCHALHQGIFPPQGLNPGLPHHRFPGLLDCRNPGLLDCRQILYPLSDHFSSVQSLSHVQLFVTPQTIARQAPLSTGILQARILEWVVMPFSRGSSQPRDQTQVSRLAGIFFSL